jgi:hypothetical protein
MTERALGDEFARVPWPKLGRAASRTRMRILLQG